MKSLVFHILSLFWPARCPLCGEITQTNDICDSCANQNLFISDPCTDCGCPKDKCNCAFEKHSYKCVAPFEYTGKVKHCLLNFKFKGNVQSAEWLANQMGKAAEQSFADVHFDICTCVPLTKKKERKRGYNQSALLGSSLAAANSIPFKKDTLKKLTDTPDQHGLSSKERAANLKGVFMVSDAAAVKDKTVLLVDDIKTTGTTLDECVKVLKSAGAKRVFCVCAAVTVKEF